MVNVNARYRVVEDGAYVAPGICVTCGRHGNSDERGMVDTGVDQDYYGVIYVCSMCVLEMAEQYGAASPATQLNNLAATELLERTLQETKNRLAKAERILDGIGGLHLLDADLPSTSDSIEPVVEVVEEEADESAGPVSDSVDPGEALQSAIDEPSAIEGPDDFFDSSEPEREQTLDI